MVGAAGLFASLSGFSGPSACAREWGGGRAERTTQRKNIAVGDIYKILIPQEFGGGFIRDEYCGSGIVFGDDWDHMADLYGILA